MHPPNLEQRLSVIRRDDLSRNFEAFITDCQARSLSVRTVALYHEKFAIWHTWLASIGVTDVADITPDSIRRGLVQLGKSHNPGGVHVCYRVLKTFLRWLLAEGVLERNPMQRIKPPKVTDNPLPPASLPDLKAMLATCDRSLAGQRDRAMLLGLLDTGCRGSEFCALDIGDVDLGTGAVVVRHGKGGKRRVVFLGAKTRREVMRYLRLRKDPDRGPLWVTDEGGRLTYAGLRQIVVRRARSAGVKAPSLHSFRRAFALASKRGGMDLHDLQQLMGHADLTVLRRYLATDESDLAEAHRKAGPVDRLL